jgi:CHASE2 domain-containing sensor protein
MFKRFINYVAPIWEGNDGKPSYRRFALFVILVLVCWTVFSGQAFSQYGLYVLGTLLVFFLLLSGLLTWQQLKETLHGLNPFSKRKSEGGTE